METLWDLRKLWAVGTVWDMGTVWGMGTIQGHGDSVVLRETGTSGGYGDTAGRDKRMGHGISAGPRGHCRAVGTL